MAVLNATSIYGIFYDADYIDFGNTLKNFIFEENNYVWWLGATWFIFVLFKVEYFSELYIILVVIKLA